MKVSSTKKCLFYIINGNCLESDTCPLEHPKISLKGKSKLRYNKNNSYQPKKIKIEIKQYKCTCCKDNPYKCIGNSICMQFGRCLCVSQQDLDNMLYNDFDEDMEESCNCCFGNFFTCQTELCSKLGMCQCQLRKDMENHYEDPEDEKNYYIQESADCKCCNGYVFNCGGKNCKNNCFCFM
jgi:hypothetical protein